MRWFGRAPFAPCCEVMDHAPTPSGAACLYCHQRIEELDDGLLIVDCDPLHPDFLERAWHHGCLLRHLGIAGARA
jgi:hypothetical protein